MTNKHYQKSKERLQKELGERNQNLSEEQKNKMQEESREGYEIFCRKRKSINIIANIKKNISKEQKQKLV